MIITRLFAAAAAVRSTATTSAVAAPSGGGGRNIPRCRPGMDASDRMASHHDTSRRGDITYSTVAARLGRVVLGTVLMGLGVALVVRSRLGLVPLDVLHYAISHRLDWPLAAGIIVVQATLLILWWPLRIRPGMATIAAVVLPGVACQAAMAALPEFLNPAARIGMFAVGGLAFALGVATYLTAELGANPRDGIILALHRRTGLSQATVRVTLDLASLAIGWALLGPRAALELGTVGVGSIVLATASGPLISWLLRHRTVRV